MAKIIDTIIQQDSAPKQTNVLWDDGTNLRIYRDTGWEIIGYERKENIPESPEITPKKQSDWLELDENSENFILNKTHGLIGGTSNIIDIVENIEEGSPISEIIESYPIQIDDVFIEQDGNYEIIKNNKKIILSVLLNNPIRVISSEISTPLKLYKNFSIKTLGVKFIDTQSLIEVLEIEDEELNNILNTIFEQS